MAELSHAANDWAWLGAQRRDILQGIWSTPAYVKAPTQRHKCRKRRSLQICSECCSTICNTAEGKIWKSHTFVADTKLVRLSVLLMDALAL